MTKDSFPGTVGLDITKRQLSIKLSKHAAIRPDYICEAAFKTPLHATEVRTA